MKKKRVVDAELVGELIELRASYDELEPTYWPTGSVEHLILERWPAKGPVEVADADALFHDPGRLVQVSAQHRSHVGPLGGGEGPGA